VTLPDPLEIALRDAVLRGDADAWRALYDRAFPAVYAYALARTRRDAEAAAEIVQEAWLVAVRRCAEFDPARGSFGAWMCGIAEFAVRNRGRREARRARHEAPATDLGRDPAAAPSPVVEGDPPDRIARAARAWAGLPAAYGAVLAAKYRDGLSVVEIAARDGRSPKAAESLLGRARDAFLRLFLASEPSS
jgi:RNA polymerase sigma-70 factor (ECF subfamily)